MNQTDNYSTATYITTAINHTYHTHLKLYEVKQLLEFLNFLPQTKRVVCTKTGKEVKVNNVYNFKIKNVEPQYITINHQNKIANNRKNNNNLITLSGYIYNFKLRQTKYGNNSIAIYLMDENGQKIVHHKKQVSAVSIDYTSYTIETGNSCYWLNKTIQTELLTSITNEQQSIPLMGYYCDLDVRLSGTKNAVVECIYSLKWHHTSENIANYYRSICASTTYR